MRLQALAVLCAQLAPHATWPPDHHWHLHIHPHHHCLPWSTTMLFTPALHKAVPFGSVGRTSCIAGHTVYLAIVATSHFGRKSQLHCLT